MVTSLMEDREIISLCSNIVETFENESPIVFDNDLANNILENMLKLYLRICSFSLTRDIVQFHKEKKKEESLRKTIKKSHKLCLQEYRVFNIQKKNNFYNITKKKFCIFLLIKKITLLITNVMISPNTA